VCAGDKAVDEASKRRRDVEICDGVCVCILRWSTAVRVGTSDRNVCNTGDGEGDGADDILYHKDGLESEAEFLSSRSALKPVFRNILNH
jgi:hypothetical protein